MREIEIEISGKIVGNNRPCFVIAEAGVNHNGDFELAKEMIDLAKSAGADAIKFQTFKTEGVVIRTANMAKYQERSEEKNQYEMLKSFELEYDDFEELKDYCDKKNIVFLSTPHSEDAIDFLDRIVPAYKIGSGDLTNLPFLEKVAEKRKPILLSTGMATLGEIEDAIRVIRRRGWEKIIILHCVTSYPLRIEDANLRTIQTLKYAFRLPVGFSDHTLEIITPAAAVSLGACIIEKHFTPNRSLHGPDHKASLEPREFKMMVDYIRLVEKSLGDGVKVITGEEEEIKKIARKSIVSKTDIPQGTVITRDLLEIKRPGTGIAPKSLLLVVGKRAKSDIKKDELITWNMIT